MHLGRWNSPGDYSVSDLELEGDMQWQPTSGGKIEQARATGSSRLSRHPSAVGSSIDGSATGDGGIERSPRSGDDAMDASSPGELLFDRHPKRWDTDQRGLERGCLIAAGGRPDYGSSRIVGATGPSLCRASGPSRVRFFSEDGSQSSGARWSRGRLAGFGRTIFDSLRRGHRRSYSIGEPFDRDRAGVGPGNGPRMRGHSEAFGASVGVWDGMEELIQVDFDPDFDTSRQHLVKLFNALDKVGRGKISYEAMRIGLASLGTYSDINYLVKQADLNKSKFISIDDFVVTVQEHAAKMFAAKLEVPVSCFCYDYSAGEVVFRWINTGRENSPVPSVPLGELMAEKETDRKCRVRWICLTGSDPSLVIRLANRYGIHPLQVEDCLNPKERLKVDAFRAPAKTSDGPRRRSNGNSRDAVPLNAKRADTSPRVCRNGEQTNGFGSPESSSVQAKVYTGAVQREGHNEQGKATGFAEVRPVAGCPPESGGSDEAGGARMGKVADGPTNGGGSQGGSILHVLLARITLREPAPGRPCNFDREQVSIFLVDDHTVIYIERSASDVSDNISNRMYYAGSKLRLNNARYLVYSLIDSIVDGVFPIMQHYQEWLLQVQEKLHSSRDGPSLEVVRAIQQISRDMHMIVFYLRPMKMVATQLITDLPGNDADLRRHLEDLRDHLLVLEEQALRMSTWSRSLNKDWVNEQQHRMNQVVYILTMVTSAFMPAQFLTGVFGMNFKFMPELNWRYSYASFWVLVALLALTSFTVYKRQKWL